MQENVNPHEDQPATSEPPVNMEVDAASEQRSRAKQLVVGLDLGTTYVHAWSVLDWRTDASPRFSGVSFQLYDPNSQRVSEAEIRTVRAWRSSRGPDHDESKVPSKISYDWDGEVMEWGFEADGSGGVIMEWFKLALVATKDLPSHLQDSTKLNETKKNMRDLGISAGSVMAQYMDKIWAHAQEEIKKTIGRRALESLPIHVVITIPAIWDNQAIQTMRDAAASSILRSRPTGLTSYEFLSEPEAAVQAYAKELQLKLDIGDAVLVVDLGGGTGDIIPYLKAGEGGEDYLELREAAPGDGKHPIQALDLPR